MKNKLVYIMIAILIVIALAGAAFWFVLSNNNTDKETEAPSIDKVIEYSVDIPQITSTLADGGFIKVTFKVETDNKKAKAELEKRVFQVKDISNGLLADMNYKDLSGNEGQEYLKKSLMDRLNELMQEGKVVKVYIVENILQK